MPIVVTMATNTHEQISLIYLGASVFVVILSFVLGVSGGPYLAVFALVIFEFVMILFGNFSASRV